MLKKINNKQPDTLDYNILRELMENARISNTEIGRRIGLSAPAVAERIQKLEDHGYIKGHHTEIDFEKLGLSIRAFLTFKTTSIKHGEAIKLMEQRPEVIEWYSVTGSFCMLVKVAVATSRELERFIEDLADVGETTTFLVLSEGKYSHKKSLNGKLIH